MSADAPDPDEVVTRAEHARCIHDDYLVDDEVDRVDLSDLRLDDDDDWLYVPPQRPIESPIQDLYAWLKTEPELDVRNNKKFIDTRTFTRPKKRSARMSFESIFEGLSPSTTSTQKLQDVGDITLLENEEKCLPAAIGVKESVPPILKPFTSVSMNIPSDENSVTSGQESMEAFLNLSQSKGIDSFINLGEPEFNDLTLMNMSQPSVLFTSVIASANESTFVRNDTTLVINEKAQNIDTKDSSNPGNETFVMQNADNTITLDVLNRPENTLSNIHKEFFQLDEDLNKTYNTGASARTSPSRSSLDKEKSTTLSSTFVAEPNATFVQLQNKASNGIKSLDATYLSSARDAERPNSPISINDTYIPTMHANKANLNVTCNLSNEAESAMLLTRETRARESALNISFKVPGHQSTPMNPNIPNATSKLAATHLDQQQPTAFPTTLKAPTSLRRELLAEIQRSGERKLDATYNHIPSEHLSLRETKEDDVHVVCDENETDVPPMNRYYTYKKTAFTANQGASQNETAVTAQKELSVDQRKFYTFTKKSYPVERIDNTAGESVKTRPNMDSTFCKPHLPKVQQKRNIPRTLSKLPQFFQKSNPNLVSNSMKSAGTGVPVGRTGISSIGYIKGSQPNIGQNVAEKSQLPSKLHPYGKVKSGSEQRLLEVNVNANNQFPMKSTIAGSTESIESTHSIHSAPDLDDRLSTCSDSSGHNLCTNQTIEQLHKLVRMQEESLRQDSAPQPHRLLENTWVEAKMNLPSPILKNGLEYSEGDKHLLNTDLSMKCSSPLASPTGSSHALNNDGNAEGRTAKTKDETVVIEKTESSNQAVPKIENKTRLRQPTNWNAGSKPAAVISGIPRPASRIPAPRFVRPSAKPTQSDLRKGCT